MHRTFNCGVGMVICVSAKQTPQALEVLAGAGEKPWILGEITVAEADENQLQFI